MGVLSVLRGANDLELAERNRRRICEPRGYCGPFADEEYFATFDGGLWLGSANCVHCGSTVNVGEELEKWEAALWRREFGLAMATEGTTAGERPSRGMVPRAEIPAGERQTLPAAAANLAGARPSFG